MTAQLLPWRKPKVRVLEWPTMIGPLNSFVMIIKDGQQHSFRSIPIVTVTTQLPLVSALIRYFGTAEVITVSRLRQLIASEEQGGPLRTALGDMAIGDMKSNAYRIGNLLSDLSTKGEIFNIGGDSYYLEQVLDSSGLRKSYGSAMLYQLKKVSSSRC